MSTATAKETAKKLAIKMIDPIFIFELYASTTLIFLKGMFFKANSSIWRGSGHEIRGNP